MPLVIDRDCVDAVVIRLVSLFVLIFHCACVDMQQTSVYCMLQLCGERWCAIV